MRRATILSPKAQFKKQMKQVRVEFMKEMDEKRMGNKELEKKQQDIKEFIHNQRLQDIKEFKKETLLESKPLPKRESNHHLCLEEESKRRMDQLLSLYYASQEFVTYDNLDYKIEMAIKSPKSTDPIQKKLEQLEQRLDSKYDTIMNQHATTSQREKVLKQQLLNVIQDQPGKYQIEQKQGNVSDFKSVVSELIEKEKTMQ
jgi:hypothetical protein